MARTSRRGDRTAPMLAKLEHEIPRGEGWTYEPKWDGFRTIVTAGIPDPDGIRLISRDDRPMMRFFPEVVELLVARRVDPYMADGELLLVRPGGLAFDELQLRLHPAASRVAKLAHELPATLMLFDLLERAGEDLRSRPLAERRSRLAELAVRVGAAPTPERLEDLPAGPDLRLTPWTADVEVADRWFADETGLGEDGIVAKRADQVYLPGQRGWVKVKHRRTVDCVVGGYRVAKGGDGVGSLLLGLYDNGNLHYVGHTSSFTAAERRAIREKLAPLEGGEGFGGGRDPGGLSRWSGSRESQVWVSLAPSVVCEVSIDRLQGGRFRHAATFVRWRDDRDARSCTFGQLGASPPSWG